jgi:hypothetical protein
MVSRQPNVVVFFSGWAIRGGAALGNGIEENDRDAVIDRA